MGNSSASISARSRPIYKVPLYCPPSTVNITPVRYDAAGESRKTAAFCKFLRAAYASEDAFLRVDGEFLFKRCAVLFGAEGS